MSDADYRRASGLVRAGLGLGAVAALLVALAPLGDLTSGPARGAAARTVTQTLSPGIAVAGALAAVVLLGAAMVPRLWVHLLGLAIATAISTTAGLVVLAGRTSSDFVRDATISLELGGALLVLAFWVGYVGVVTALIGFRRVALSERAAEPRQAASAGSGDSPRSPRSPKAPLAVVLGVAGFFLWFTSSLAIAFGTLALGDIQASQGRLGGKGMAITGLVLGFLSLSALVAIVGVGALTGTPR